MSSGRTFYFVRITALTAFAALTFGCGGSSDDPGPSPETNWDSLNWDSGEWARGRGEVRSPDYLLVEFQVVELA
jgi:hypothetical protein